MPKTADNFKHLCIGDKTNAEGKKLTYVGSGFHRIIKDFMCVAAAVLLQAVPLQLCQLFRTVLKLTAQDPGRRLHAGRRHGRRVDLRGEVCGREL